MPNDPFGDPWVITYWALMAILLAAAIFYLAFPQETASWQFSTG